MSNKLLLFISALCFSMISQAAEINPTGQIVLNPYVSGLEYISPNATSLLTDKLAQAVTRAGVASSGFDQRFVIAANVQVLKEETTSTIPAKTAIELSVTFYVGDGMEGNLFSSYNTGVKGFGSSRSSACQSAMRRINVQDPGLKECIETGKRKIVSYYNAEAGNILSKAKSLAQSTRYDEALATLLTIPSACNAYSQAQSLVAQYGGKAVENANRELIIQATAAWSASPTEQGARQARNILMHIDNPSQAIVSEAQSLSNQMATRLQKNQEHEWQLLSQVLEQRHQERLANINKQRAENVAAILGEAQVRAAYASRPKIIYRIHWW
jgi:hypothetical protein